MEGWRELGSESGGGGVGRGISIILCQKLRMPKISVLQGFLSEAGFGLGSVMVLPDLLFKPELWYDKEMPFRKHWRSTVRYIYIYHSMEHWLN